MSNYLIFASVEPFAIAVNNATKNWDGILEYSTDAASWNEWDGTTAIASAEHDGGQRIYMRGSGNTKISESAKNGFGNYVSTKNFVLTGSNIRCDGNIENLLGYEAVANGEHPNMASSCFGCLFQDCAALISAPTLPADTLTHGCYEAMFYGCTNLTTAPELPATALAYSCYAAMFRGCTSLTTPPALPATILANYCYSEMFSGCTGLIAPPQLPAITMASNCYRRMFYYCSSLLTAPSLPATALAPLCYYYMFANCSGLLTVPSLPATELPNTCYGWMFSGCKGLKFSETQSEEYPNEYRIPASGIGVVGDPDGTNPMIAMFSSIGTGDLGTYAGTPEINTTYYTANKVIPATQPVAPKLDPTSLLMSWQVGNRIRGGA